MKTLFWYGGRVNKIRPIPVDAVQDGPWYVNGPECCGRPVEGLAGSAGCEPESTAIARPLVCRG